MSTPVPIQVDYLSGLVREAAVGQFLAPQSSVEFVLNFHFDRISEAQTRKGTTLLGSQVSGSAIRGMGFFRNNAGTIFAALANTGGSVFAYSGTSWSSVRSGLTATSKARFTNLVDYIFMVNGTDAIRSWSGTGQFGTTNVASLPSGDLIENYRNRIWVAESSTDKLFYSDVVTTTNTITGGTDFIQISPADGERIRALKRHPRALLVFKENHIYKVFSNTSADPDPSIFRGTYSQESVVEAKDGIYYHHPTGFYKFIFDGEQEEISRPIIDIVQAIPRSSYENIAGWVDDDHVYWAIGDITLDGISFQNIEVRWTISTKVWTIYSKPTQILSSTLYDSGSVLVSILGDESGNVLQHDIGNTDNGTPIFYDLITHFRYLTEIKDVSKSCTELSALHENAHGAQISYQIDSDNQKKTNNTWTPIGQISKDIYEVLSLDAQHFTRIRFRVSGSSSGVPIIFRGLEILNLVIQSTTK